MSEPEKNEEIESDFKLFLKILKENLIYILTFPINLLLVLFFLITFNMEKCKEYLSKIFLIPFRQFKIISEWFFEAKYTAMLSIFLIMVFFIEFLYLIPQNLIDNLLFSFYDFFDGNFYSIFTSLFLHADIEHILGNLISLIVFGRIVEKKFEKHIISIFIVSGIVANLFSGVIYYLNSNSTASLGASGGIAGLIILGILLEPFSFSMIAIIPLPVFLIGFFSIFYDLTNINSGTNINHFAHIGGYLAILLIYFFLSKNKEEIKKGFFINILLLIISIIGVLFFI